MFTEADLPIDADGRIYHLALHPEQLAPNIILVGDPERVPLLAGELLDSVEADVDHRGLRSMTGTSKEFGYRLSIITTGMGTPSLEIVLQEIAALNEIDFERRERKLSWPALRLLRVGTSGALHRDLELGTSVISEYALGLDNTGLFYEAACPDQLAARIEAESLRLLSERSAESRFAGSVRPYAARAAPRLRQALQRACEELEVPHKIGITVSSSGFFANQGRDIVRIPPAIADIDRLLCTAAPFEDSLRFENMEMEASFLLHWAAGLGYEAGAICPVIANRSSNRFADDYRTPVIDAARAAVRAFSFFHREQ